MENFKKLLRLAKRLELKYIIAEDVSTSGEDDAVRAALEKNGLMDPNLIAPYMAQAGIPSDAVVNVTINIQPGYSVSFTATAVPSPKPNRGNYADGPEGDVEFAAAMKEYNTKVTTYAALGPKLSALLLKGLSQKMFNALKKEKPPVNALVKLRWAEFK